MRSRFDLGVDRPERPLRKDERVAVWVMVGLFCGGFALELLVNDFTPAKLSAFFIPLLWMPLVALHEAGHAVAARLCGWRVKRVVIGFGPVVKSLRIASTPVHLCQVPLEGYVLPYPTHLRSPRLRSSFIYAAGPGVELMLVLAIYLALGHDSLLSRSTSVGLIAAQSLCIAALMGVTINLVPHWTQKGGWSDGMGILMSWRLPDEHFQAICRKR